MNKVKIAMGSALALLLLIIGIVGIVLPFLPAAPFLLVAFFLCKKIGIVL